jgi:hypothetical protein
VTIREQVTIRAWVECVGCGRTFEKCAALPSDSLTTSIPHWLEILRSEVLATLRSRQWVPEDGNHRCAHCVAVLVDPLGGAP